MEALSSSALHRRITQLSSNDHHPIVNPLPVVVLQGSFLLAGNHKPIQNSNSSSGSVIEEIQLDGDYNVLRRSLEIRLVDDTALIDLGLNDNKNKKKKQPKKDSAGGKKESEAKKPRRRRSSKAANKGSGEKRSSKIVYSRNDLEALRYRNVKAQRKLWHKLYTAFSPIVTAEYHALGGGFTRHNNNSALLGRDSARDGGNCRVFGGGEGRNDLDCCRGGVNWYGCGRFASG